MKTLLIYFVMCLFILSADAVINQPTQEAQRREAPAQHQQYGPPKPPPQGAIRQNRFQAMQRLVAAMRNGGYAAAGQGRVVNRPRPIPLAQPQNSYGPPKNSYGPPPSSSSGSLANFMNNHTPDVKCDGWIPIPGPSIGSGHSSSGGAASIDSSYGPPRHGSGSSGLNTQIVVIPEDTYGPPPPVQPLSSYGTPDHGHSSNSGSAGISISLPSDSYGPPNHGHSSSGGSSGHSSSLDDSYGPPNHGHSSNSGSAGISISLPSNSYGPPSHGHSSSGGSSSHSSSLDDSYGPPPPAPVYNHESSSHSGHSSVSSVSSIGSSFNSQSAGHASYGAPQQQPKIPGNTYGPPQTIDTSYGVPSAPESNFGVAPESSYGPPPSGHAHSEHSSQGHAGHVQTVQSFGQDLQLPEIDSGVPFNNAIGLVTSSLGVSAGHSEVVQSHAIHESHTQELSNNFNGGDSYSAPPLDSYEPGKYAPSFLNPQQRPQQQHSTPINFPQRPLLPRPQQHAPQYRPPIPMKLFRPQGPPPSGYRTQANSHAQSIAQGYSSGQSHKQSIHAPGPVRQQPKYPLPHRAPVPHGLFESIGQNVQAQDNGQRSHHDASTYLPPPPSELPIKLNLPSPAPASTFLTQHQSHDSGSHASSSGAYSFQNQEFQNVRIIHDCGKGPQLSQGYAGSTQNIQAPSQNYGAPTQSYGAPAESYEAPAQSYGTPAQDYGTPLGEPLTKYEPRVNGQLQELSGNYEIPSGDLLVPQHNSIDFSSQSNSYGPPASGPASTDVIGLESQRANSVINSEQQNLASISSSSQSHGEQLPGLSSGLSGLNFISAQKSHSIDVPSQGGQVDSYQLQFTSSVSDHGSNQLDAQNHNNILADGLLNSIISAIEKKPIQTVPQVTEDLDTDHSEVQVFLKSPTGQEVLADKTTSSDEHISA